MDFVRPEILAQRDALADTFRNAQPFRHVVIDNCFAPAFCRRILDDFPRFEDRYALNEMGEVSGKAVRMNVREISTAFSEFDLYLQTSEFLNFVSAVTGIPNLLYDADYIGGGTHENRDGQGLDAHVDFNYHPKTKTHRRLNLILYLNHEWDASWGGALELHSDPWNPKASQTRQVLPLFNRAVIFETTENSWHGFSGIALPADRKAVSRKSFAIYLYTKERPSQETAAPHATIYVPDSLPECVTLGKTLGAEDVVQIQQRFVRMRTQLRYLYDREKQFGAQIASLEHALQEARDAYRVPLQGYAMQVQSPQGVWIDGWVGGTMEVTLQPTRSLRALELKLWVPEQLDGDQVLNIELGGQRWQHHVARGAHSSAVLAAKGGVGDMLTLRVEAERCFVPAQSNGSSDTRNLAWRLLSVIARH